MPTAISGTNGVLQSYDFQVLTTGFLYNFASGTTTLIANPAGTLATGTITMPATPADGMVITIESTQQITALTVQGNSGQSLVGGTITMRANQPESFIYRLTDTTWYPFAGATNSQLILDTAQNSTSGTSIDFTGIPSWVRRITVMFNGVSLSSTAQILVQLGVSGTPTTTGYNSTASYVTTGSVGYAGLTSTSGFIAQLGASNYSIYGSMTISNLSGNLWVCQGVLANVVGVPYTVMNAGSAALGGVLNMIRITTTNGTDTFDAGSINILYE